MTYIKVEKSKRIGGTTVSSTQATYRSRRAHNQCPHLDSQTYGHWKQQRRSSCGRCLPCAYSLSTKILSREVWDSIVTERKATRPVSDATACHCRGKRYYKAKKERGHAHAALGVHPAQQ